MAIRKSPAAASELGVSYYRLINLLRGKKVAPPSKDSSGDYVWTDADLDAARQALLIDRRRKGKSQPTAEN